MVSDSVKSDIGHRDKIIRVIAGLIFKFFWCDLFLGGFACLPYVDEAGFPPDNVSVGFITVTEVY